jgi:hypothetical protein
MGRQAFQLLPTDRDRDPPKKIGKLANGVLCLAASSSTLAELDDRFDRINPGIWPAFEKIALEVFAAGQKTSSSSSGVLHIVPYHSLVRMNDETNDETG